MSDRPSLINPDDFSSKGETGDACKKTAEKAQIDVSIPESTILNEAHQALKSQLAALRAQEIEMLGVQSRAKRAYMQAHSAFRHPFVIAEATDPEQRAKILIESESRNQFLIESNLTPAYKVNKQGEILYANEAAARLLQFPRELLMDGKMRVEAITPIDCRHNESQRILELQDQMVSHTFHSERLTASGQRIAVAVTFRQTRMDNSEWTVFMLDLSVQKSLEDLLKNSQKRFEALVKEMPHIAFLLNDTGAIRQFNKRFYELTGIEPDFDNGTIWREKVHPSDLPKLQKIFAESLEARTNFECEARLASTDGDYLWHLIRGQLLKKPLPGHVQGLVELTIDNCTESAEFMGDPRPSAPGSQADSFQNLPLWVCTATDIDERKQLLEEVLESAHLFQALADQIPQIVWTAGPEGRIDFFNNRWFQYSGLTREHRVGLDWALFIHPDDRKTYMTHWRECIKSGDAFECEFKLQSTTGNPQDQNDNDIEITTTRIPKPGEASDAKYHRFLARAVSLRNSQNRVVQWVGTWTPID
jgi:PAS domain S-box-containing protein